MTRLKHAMVWLTFGRGVALTVIFIGVLVSLIPIAPFLLSDWSFVYGPTFRLYAVFGVFALGILGMYGFMIHPHTHASAHGHVYQDDPDFLGDGKVLFQFEGNEGTRSVVALAGDEDVAGVVAMYDGNTLIEQKDVPIGCKFKDVYLHDTDRTSWCIAVQHMKSIDRISWDVSSEPISSSDVMYPDDVQQPLVRLTLRRIGSMFHV